MPYQCYNMNIWNILYFLIFPIFLIVVPCHPLKNGLPKNPSWKRIPLTLAIPVTETWCNIDSNFRTHQSCVYAHFFGVLRSRFYCYGAYKFGVCFFDSFKLDSKKSSSYFTPKLCHKVHVHVWVWQRKILNKLIN